jgi:hypothetical protein
LNPQAIINLALIGLNAALGLIAQVRGQAGVTDDAILASAQSMVGANDQLYDTILAALKQPPPTPPAPPVVGL